MNFVSQAQEFIDGGFNPLPLQIGKNPKLPQGHPFLYKWIDRVSQRFSNCEMIGVVCGTISGGFYCIDFDKHGGQDIEPVYNDFIGNGFVKYLIQEGMFTVFKTPSGGYHFYYKHEIEHGGQKIAYWDPKNIMIETRGNGQYVATYPSPGYKKIKGPEIYKLNFISPEDLQHIVNMCTSFCKVGSEIKTYDKTPSKSDRAWPEKWDDSKPDGNFNNTQADYAKEILKKHGWKLISIRRTDGVELWQRPGKEIDQGTSATFGVKRHMFYNFSSSASPFEPFTAYTPFNIYTILEHAGDWRKAKDSLKPSEQEPETPDTHSFFPIEVFPKFIQQYILELNKTLNFHVDFLAAAAMFTIATLNGNKMIYGEGCL